MSKKVRVTVLMSVYNDQNYLGSSIESILNQSFSDFELIIIDDGSTDTSGVILNEYANKDNRIKIVKHKNIGLTKSLNKGLKLSAGKYIARQDSNDLSYPERLSTQYEFMEANHRVAVCWTWFNVINKFNEIIGKFEFPTKNIKIKKKIIKANVFPHSGSFFRKKEIFSVGGYRNIFLKAQDFDLWLRVIERYDVGAINKTLFSYRFCKNGMTGNDRSDQPIFAKLARDCYYARKENKERIVLDNFDYNKNANINLYHSIENLYLANLYMRSNKNYEAAKLFRRELNKKINPKILLKFVMCLIPFNWSYIFRKI